MRADWTVRPEGLAERFKVQRQLDARSIKRLHDEYRDAIVLLQHWIDFQPSHHDEEWEKERLEVQRLQNIIRYATEALIPAAQIIQWQYTDLRYKQVAGVFGKDSEAFEYEEYEEILEEEPNEVDNEVVETA